MGLSIHFIAMLRGARIKRSPIRIGEHMPAWSVMDLSSLQAAEQPFQYLIFKYIFIDIFIY